MRNRNTTAVNGGDMERKGFMHEKTRIFFIEGRGKDISFERWRVSLYYAPHYAKTYFLETEKEYHDFITTNQRKCYLDYGLFRQEKEYLDRRYAH